MVKNGENRYRHGPERSHRNTEVIPQLYHPGEEGISNDGRQRRMEAGEQSVSRSLHIGVNRSDETGEVVSAAKLGRDDIGDGSESNVLGFGFAGEEGEPLVGDDEGDKNIWVFKREELAEVHKGVDMASAGVRHRRQMGLFGCCGTDRIHFFSVVGMINGGEVSEGIKTSSHSKNVFNVPSWWGQLYSI